MALEYISPATGIVVALNDITLAFFRDHRQQRWKRERGGQLFADVLKSNRVNIVEATLTPGLWHKPFGYKPDINLQQLEIKNKYTQGLHYVGDWHSHPQVQPVPSSQDEIYMRDLVRLSKGNLRYFITAIIGTGSQPQGLYLALQDNQKSYRLDLY